MGTVTLTDPTTGTTVASGLVATNNAQLRAALNGGLDGNNFLGQPALASGETVVWAGTQFVRSTVTKLGASSLSGVVTVATGTVSASNVDLAWGGGSAVSHILGLSGSGGSIRSIAAPTAGDGTRLVIRSGSGTAVTLLHNTAGGTGKKLILQGSVNTTIGGTSLDEKIEFYYDVGSDVWIEINRDHGTGAWVAYTPVWTTTGTAPSIGNGTLTGRYTVIGKTVHWQLRWVAGSTTTFGTNVWLFTMPVAPASAITVNQPIGWTESVDTSANQQYMGQCVWSSGSIATILSSASPQALYTNLVPFTWANTDYLLIGGTYEAA